uniref:LIM domain and actin-binding protein 1-like n=1 Tax=Scleropages formosus TaxID=113540 RepID=A0A8C9S4H9_SCLFO
MSTVGKSPEFPIGSIYLFKSQELNVLWETYGMETSSFSRRSWTSSSLRITAKELSLVSSRGQSNAIAERFSKYQKAAEEAQKNTDKKKLGLETLPPTFRSGKLSVLKKRWEQPAIKEKPTAVPRVPSRARHTPPPSATMSPTPVLSSKEEHPSTSKPSTPQGSYSHFQYPTPSEKVPEGSSLDQKPQSKTEHIEGECKKAAMPAALTEKSTVPLTNPKMKFAEGEKAQDKVSTGPEVQNGLVIQYYGNVLIISIINDDLKNAFDCDPT